MGAGDHSDDPELLARLRAGDSEAFRELVRRHHASMLRVAAAFVAGPADAEDAVQDTWIAVIRGIDGFEGRSSLRSWIFAILVNRARSHGASQARRPEPTDLTAEADAGLAGGWFTGRRGRGSWQEPVPAWQDDPQLSLDSAEALAVVLAAIADLPPSRRQVVVLRDVEGWTAQEVSELLGITDANQRVLLHRGRNTLRLALRRRLDEQKEADR